MAIDWTWASPLPHAASATARLDKSLRDPSARLDELLEAVDEERCAAAAATVKGQVEARLKKCRGFALAPLADGAGEGDATKEGAPLVGDGGVQG